ncbi:MAG: hypothetical protein N3A38_11225, partial [Planctomycetota bacterium]|nr:hypothetical protein [Planctomycetota bacterium]
VAQATAAMKGFESIGSGGPGGIGMLAGVSEFEILDVPPAGARAEVEVREEKRMGALALVSGEVRVEGRTVARGRIKVYAGG